MEPKLVERPAHKIAGHVLKTRSGNGENRKAIPEFWTSYMTDGRMEKLHQESFLNGHAEYGACFPEDPETGEFEYVIGVVVKDGAAVPKDYQVYEIPAALYAVFSVPPSGAADFSSAIQGAWDYIFAEWFPGSGYELDGNGVDYELYDMRKGEEAPFCDIYIPVVKKG